MRIGVDSSVVVAAVHANHPYHAVAASWVVDNLRAHELVVAHHSVVEAYAVLTRLPGDLCVTPSEARDLLRETVRSNMAVAGLRADSVWTLIESLVASSVAGGRSYDALIAQALVTHGAPAIATFNPSHFRGLAGDVAVIDPSRPGA